MTRNHKDLPILIRLIDGQTFDPTDHGVCWWDLHEFKWESVPAPAYKRKGVWHVLGHFCSPECMKAYISSKNWEDKSLKIENVRTFLIEIEYSRKGPFFTAPPREMLKIFDPINGMDITQFRKASQQGSYKFVKHPMLVISQQVWDMHQRHTELQGGETDQVKKKRVGQTKLNDFIKKKKS